MGNSALSINYNIFEELVEFKDINCKVIKMETPLEITKILNESKSIVKLFKKEKDFTKKRDLRESNVITLIKLFTSVTKNKVFLQNIISYLQKVKIKCKKEYDKYTKKIIKQKLFCDIKGYKFSINSLYNDYLLNKIIVKYTNHIIKNIEIDNKIVEIEEMKYNILNKSYSIILHTMETFDIFFEFSLIKNPIFHLDNKYEDMKKELLKLYEEITKNNIHKNYDEINYKKLINLGKLYEKYDTLYCKLLKDIINDKEYIKSYIEYIKLLKEQSVKDYNEHSQKIIRYIDYLNSRINKNIKDKCLIKYMNKLRQITVK